MMKGERKPLYVAPVPVRTIADNKLAALEKILLQSQVLDESHHELLTDHQNIIQKVNNKDKDTPASMKQNCSAIGNIWLSNKSIAPPQTVKHNVYYLKNKQTKLSVNKTKAREYLDEIRTASYQERFSRQRSRLFIFLHTF